MKVAIIGTRGIPNHYGGFEQFAQFLSEGLVAKGHQVFVYNSHNHPYSNSTWNGVNIIHRYDPEYKIGTAGQFLYDLNCISDTRKHHFDVILNLGYTSSSIWSRLFPKKPVLITNMDGLEWKRTKFSKNVQRFLRYAEKLAVKHSDVLVADSKAIKDYILKRYGNTSHFIAYGAHMFNKPNEAALQQHGLLAGGYDILVARMEPENNIETILDGVQQAKTNIPCLVIGNYKNKFGSYLAEKFKNEKRIIFMGPIYDLDALNNLRYFCRYYFHGHSVGGTNPSLLEAMACHCMVISHRNEFNESVLEKDALYFSTAGEIANILEQPVDFTLKKRCIDNNRRKIETTYAWPNIIDQYETLMLNAIQDHG